MSSKSLNQQDSVCGDVLKQTAEAMFLNNIGFIMGFMESAISLDVSREEDGGDQISTAAGLLCLFNVILSVSKF